MKKVNINKLLRNVFLVLAIILLCLKIVGRVSAEEMSNDDISYLENIFKECDNYDTAVPYLEWVYANFPYYYYWHSENQDYFCFYHVPDFYISHAFDDTKTIDGFEKLDYYVRSDYSFIGSQNRWIYTYFRDSISGVSVSNPWYTNTYDDDICSVCIYVAHFNGDYLNESFNSMAIGFYGFDTSGNPSTQTCTVYSPDNINEVVESNVSYMSHQYVNSNWAQSILTTSKDAGFRSPFGYIGHSYNPDTYFFSNAKYSYWNDLGGYNGYETPTDFICNYNCKYVIDAGRLWNPLVYQFDKNVIYPDESNTYKFNCYTEGSYGINYLICDFSELVSISPAVGNNSTLSIKVVADDISEMYVNLDSTSEYYQYSVSDHRARYVIPFSYFGDLDNYADVYLTDIQVVNTTSSPGGSYSNTFKYFTPYIYLKKSYNYNSEEIPKYDYTPEISDDDFDDLNEYIDYAVMGLNDGDDKNGLVFPASVFNFQYYQLPSWCNVTHIDLYGLYETGQDKYYSIYWRDFTPHITQPDFPFDNEIDLYRELMGNNYGQYYDVVVVQINYVYGYYTGSDFYYDANDNPKKVMYGLFYTQRYYDHLAGIQNNDIIGLLRGISDRNYKTYEYLKDRLDRFSNNFSDYAKDNNSLLYEIKQSLDGISNKIIGNVNNISIDTDYDLNALGNELKTLFIPSLTWESINFNDYLDSMGVLALPFEFTNDILTVARSNYSSTLDLHINDFAVPLGSDVGSFTVFEDQDYSFNPLSIFPRNGWELLQYLNAFAVIIGESWFTYCHIFRRSKSDS